MQVLHRAAVLAALPVLGCSPGGITAPGPFVVLRIAPDAGAEGEPPLLLNDAITAYFSAPIDPLSVTDLSFGVYDAAGPRREGRVRVGDTWITFEPDPPLTAALTDGSFVPGGEYRLVIVGYPDTRCIKAADRRRLDASFLRSFRTVALDALPPDLPGPLRPVDAGSQWFLFQPVESAPGVPADDPRVRLQFTLPVSPMGLSPEAFEVSLLPEAVLERGVPLPVVPRAARLLALPPRIGAHPGSTVKLDLGSQVRTRATGELVSLHPGDIVWIDFARGEHALRDYSGRELQIAPGPQPFLVVEGSATAVVEWPAAGEDWFPGADPASPGFEVVGGDGIRPLVRTEAGDGSLGLFRPQRDVVLVPGEPFDRGDGVLVRSRGPVFPFSAVDVPPGVSVRVAASTGPVQILARGRVRIGGKLVVLGEGRAASVRSGDLAEVDTVLEGASLGLVAAGGIRVDGSIEAGGSGQGVPLALVSGSTIELHGPIPLGSVLATEQGSRRVTGYAERYLSVTVRMTSGLLSGEEVTATGATPFHALPRDCTGGIVRLLQCDPRLTFQWQSAPPDPVRAGEPLLDPARMSQPRPVHDGQRVDVAPGSFVRMFCSAEIRGGEDLPRLGSIRWLEGR